jgi:catechol 2,3-dioxygenase-like lactoylglutathione lyase family enzyme
MNMKLEVVIVRVSDVDRAKAFYEKLGFRLDIDVVNENFRGIQFTPPNSKASIIFGKGVTPAMPGSADLVLAVDNVDAAREDLIARGVNVSEVFHYAGGPFNNAIENPRVAGRDPEGRSYFSFVSFEDPDREPLAATGNHDATSRPRMEVDASTRHGRRNSCRAPPRYGETPW